jgi:hypothetical protein
MVPFMAALMTFGADRIMFSVDYPFASKRARGHFSTRFRFRRPTE